MDKDTGYVIEMLRSCYFHEVYFNGEAVSEAGIRELRGSRLEISFLADNASEIRVVNWPAFRTGLSAPDRAPLDYLSDSAPARRITGGCL